MTGLVREALAEVPCEVATGGAGRWSLARPGHPEIVAWIDEAGRWLRLAATPRTGDPLRHEPAPALLARVARLAGLAKFSLDHGAEVGRVCAELPLDVDGALAPRVDATVGGMLAALGAEPVARAPGAATTTAVPEEAPDVAELCRAAGAVLLARRPELVAVDLALADVATRTRVAATADGIRAWTELAAVPARPSPACGEALARFLLALSAGVCMVRPFVATPAGEHARVGFEACLAGATCPRELAHALAALAVAARMSGREIQVLGRDETVAATFLAVLREARGAPARAAIHQPSSEEGDEPC